MAVAQPHTPGLSQTLLLLLGVPLVLLISWAALGKRPSTVAALAAALIIAGTACSGLRGVLQPSSAEPGPAALIIERRLLAALIIERRLLAASLPLPLHASRPFCCPLRPSL